MSADEQQLDVSGQESCQKVLSLASNSKRILTGIIEPADISPEDFERQRRLEAGLVKKKVTKRPRQAFGNASDIDSFQGPWARFADELTGEQASKPSAEEYSGYLEEKANIIPATLNDTIRLGHERSVFHGPPESLLTSSYLKAPTIDGFSFGKAPGSFQCSLPKKQVHTWTGHTKGINVIKMFPVSGHLLLSGGQDQRIKLWRTTGDREAVRTFYGHNKAVRDMAFDVTGARFASCSYDKGLRLWDTETGKCLFGKDLSTAPTCLQFGVLDDGRSLLVGAADNKICQWDLRTEEVAIEYDQHQGSISSLTFFDDGRKFVSTSDDKTLRIWEYGNAACSKKIEDFDLHKLPRAVHHPTEPFIAFQSLKNKIMVFSTEDNLHIRNKKFIGHSPMGYPCHMSFSPDGHYIASGDGKGQLFIWDWASGGLAKKFAAHDQVLIDVKWNPQEASKVATCSWDGTIKYWE